MDTSVHPGDDFYQHANGAWLQAYELPADKTAFGNFYELFEKSQERVQVLIEELAAAQPQTGTVEQKIGDYYASFLDTDRLDAQGYEPIRTDLQRIRAVDSRSALAELFGWIQSQGGESPLALGIQSAADALENLTVAQMRRRKMLEGWALERSRLGMPMPGSYYRSLGSTYNQQRTANMTVNATINNGMDQAALTQMIRRIIRQELT